MDGWVGGWMDDGRMDGWMDDGRMDKRMHGCLDVCLYMDGWMIGWAHGSSDVWVDKLIHKEVWSGSGTCHHIQSQVQ